MADDRRNAPGLHVDEPLDEAAIREFSSQVQGLQIRPDDDGYDEARAVFYGGFDRRPELIPSGSSLAT